MYLCWRIVYIHWKATSIFSRAMGPPQHGSMLNLHALTQAYICSLTQCRYTHTKHRHIASFKASVRCPSAPTITMITNNEQHYLQTIHLLLALKTFREPKALFLFDFFSAFTKVMNLFVRGPGKVQDILMWTSQSFQYKPIISNLTLKGIVPLIVRDTLLFMVTHPWPLWPRSTSYMKLYVLGWWMETTVELRLPCSYHFRPEVDHKFQFNWWNTTGLSNMSLNSQKK